MSANYKIEHIDIPKPNKYRLTVLIAVLGTIALLIWASLSKIDQVTRAQGQVIASARTQQIQALDGGVLKELFVKEGDKVEKGDLLAVLEQERAQAALDDVSNKVAALRITITRLNAEVLGRPLRFAKDLKAYKEFIRNQTDLYNKRQQSINEDIAGMQVMLDSIERELTLNKPLLAFGDVSSVDILKLERQAADIRSEMSNKKNKYFQDAQAELTTAQEKLRSEEEKRREYTQVLQQKRLLAPTSGYVNNINVTTIGGVARPGEVILEILPTSSDLVVEVKVRPADIAFIRAGQKASVKLDAYDFSIFGAMTGEVIYISPDTLEEDTRNGPQPYYRIQVRISHADFKDRASEIVVRPGMTATVDIKAMERTVLSYLTKPITKTLAQGMGER